MAKAHNTPQEPDFDTYIPDTVEGRFNLIDKAARKGDRWWFLALLILGMIAAGYLYWDMRGELSSVRKSQMEYLTTKNDALMSALMNNTQALNKNTQVLERIERKP